MCLVRPTAPGRSETVCGPAAVIDAYATMSLPRGVTQNGSRQPPHFGRWGACTSSIGVAISGVAGASLPVGPVPFG
jgi:hypothetical protein